MMTDNTHVLNRQTHFGGIASLQGEFNFSIDVVTLQLKGSNQQLALKRWGQQFIEHLLSITHKQ
jgi:hypothetical protein